MGHHRKRGSSLVRHRHETREWLILVLGIALTLAGLLAVATHLGAG